MPGTEFGRYLSEASRAYSLVVKPLLLAFVLLLSGWASAASVSSASLVVGRLTVTPTVTLVDSAVVVRASGLRPGSQVSLSASTLDADGRQWRSSALFQADATGVVDTRAARSLGGSYLGRHQEGLLWSMLRVRPSTPRSGEFFEPRTTATVTFDVRQQGRLLAARRLVWRGMNPHVKEAESSLADDGFVGIYDTPPVSSKRRPAVLVLGGSEGGSGNVSLARLLASHGYPALSIAYFRAPGLPSELRNIPLEYFEGALRWLAARPGVDPDRVMILGYSRGGEAALLVASTYPTLVHGVVAYVPSANVAGSCCSSFSYPAWTLNGRPVPFGLNSPIAVEKVSGPILAFGAARDQVWPSYIAVPAIVLRAKQHGKTGVAGIVYPGAGHAIGAAVPNLSVPLSTTINGRTLNFGGSIAADAQARADSWHRVLTLMKRAS